MPGPFPRSRRLGTEQRCTSSSKVTQERKDGSSSQENLEGSHLCLLRLNRAPELNGAPPGSPFPHPEASSQDPTSAPTDPPTSCHCLGSNPSSIPAAWKAQPGQGAAGLQGCPLMPRRVGGPELKTGLGFLASTNRACLSASCWLQKSRELIKNRWAREEAAAADPGPSPNSSWPNPQLRAASSLGGPTRSDVAASPTGSGYCNQCHWLHLPFQCPCWGLE